ncbi:MAG: HAMP domain-containing histidine kinase [Actinomycetia bacterium]|nr:HAMP domain-containing histidine kinase [Actinomycetes bacterium]MCP4084389.1 HAMP domain-containing histidine kinase [Actinomycetes bacterium]
MTQTATEPTRRSIGLRTRITAAFALGALLLSGLLAVTTYGATRENLLDQADDGALQQAFRNAREIGQALQVEGAEAQPILEALLRTRESQPILDPDASDPDNDPVVLGTGDLSDLPLELVTLVNTGLDGDGAAARQRANVGDRPAIAVGSPVPGFPNHRYYEIVWLDETDSTLNSLAITLLGASLITTLLGAALGAWASRRLLIPLAEVSVAAEAIAGGRLDTRLETGTDPDLASLVGSFNEMAEALERRIERDARFASDVSHELRSPLMTLSASIHVLEGRRDEMPERAQTALTLLVDDVGRFQQLVEDLLEMSRFDAGSAHLEREDVHLAEFLRQVISHSASPGVPLGYEPATADLVVGVEKRRLAQVVTNLLENARKYGGGATLVRFEVVGDEEAPPPLHRFTVNTGPSLGVMLIVEDRGDGVPVGDREAIFERFHRGAIAGRRGTGSGTGLGLALVREHIRLHGGSIEVTDRLDGESGARFVVLFPLVEAHPEGVSELDPGGDPRGADSEELV